MIQKSAIFMNMYKQTINLQRNFGFERGERGVLSWLEEGKERGIWDKYIKFSIK